MPRKRPIFIYLIFSLVAIGLLYQIIARPSVFIIPVVVLGIIYLLYKFGPRSPYRSTRPRQPKGKRPDHRRASFRVIKGKKTDRHDDPPSTH